MTASTRRELRSAATSTSTTAIGLIRALTDARPIKPTSTRCLSARRPNPGRGSTYRRGNSVQTTAATSLAEPIIIILISQHNLQYAKSACSYVAKAEGIAECKFAGDGRNLGRKLENEVRSRLATNPRCQGVDVFRQNDHDYDGKNNFNELADQMKQVHWDLFLDYNPGQTTHNWTLGHLEKLLSPSRHESDSMTVRGHGRMERAGHGAEGLFRC